MMVTIIIMIIIIITIIIIIIIIIIAKVIKVTTTTTTTTTTVLGSNKIRVTFTKSQINGLFTLQCSLIPNFSNLNHFMQGWTNFQNPQKKQLSYLCLPICVKVPENLLSTLAAISQV